MSVYAHRLWSWRRAESGESPCGSRATALATYWVLADERRAPDFELLGIRYRAVYSVMTFACAFARNEAEADLWRLWWRCVADECCDGLSWGKKTTNNLPIQSCAMSTGRA